jgi:hypothetical protein
MANTKISALPAASTPLAGTEVLPIVQGGITEQVSVDNLTAGRAVNAASLNLTGDAVLGDAATDTVRVNGYMGVGGAANAAYGILSTGAATSGANQYSVGVTATLGGTTWSSAYLAGMTIAASTTAASGAGLRVINPTLASGAAITTNYGVRVDDLTVGTTNYGIGLAVSSGTGKYNVYANGTAANYLNGSLSIGITTVSGKLTVVPSSNTQNGVYIDSQSATDEANPMLVIRKYSNTSTTSQIFARFYINSTTGSGQINANGASAAAFGSFSDQRLKENIVDLPSQLDNIMALRPVEFDYIESMGGGHQIGFIAQEVKEVYPDVVSEDSDGMLMLTDMNKNDARLIKAIQEMKTIIDTQASTITALIDRITALEGAK